MNSQDEKPNKKKIGTCLKCRDEKVELLLGHCSACWKEYGCPVYQGCEDRTSLASIIVAEIFTKSFDY